MPIEQHDNDSAQLLFVIINGEDILGRKVCDVAELVKNRPNDVSVLLWRTRAETSCDPESLCCGPMPLNLKRLSSCMQVIFTALECPVCMDTIPPPCIQCVNGHLICLICHKKANRCPMCREKYIQTRSLISEQIYNSIREVFNIEQDSSAKMREKLFGVRCKKNPNLNMKKMSSQMIHTPTHKFLARIMGKATSLDNISSRREINRQLTVEPIANGKQMSLSANDISKQDIVLYQQTLNSNNHIGEVVLRNRFSARSPASCNSSVEHMNEIEPRQIPLVLSTPSSAPEIAFRCPTGNFCKIESKASSLAHHVQVHHNTPIICFATSGAEISIPPREPVEDACLIVLLDGKQFWVKLRINNDESIFTSALLQGSDEESSQYMLEARIRNRVQDKVLQRELTTRSIVYSLTKMSWQDVFERRMGISYDYETLSATFSNEKDLVLRVDVKCRNE